VVETAGSHAIYVSRPEDVAAFIKKAAQAWPKTTGLAFRGLAAAAVRKGVSAGQQYTKPADIRASSSIRATLPELHKRIPGGVIPVHRLFDHGAVFSTRCSTSSTRRKSPRIGTRAGIHPALRARR